MTGLQNSDAGSNSEDPRSNIDATPRASRAVVFVPRESPELLELRNRLMLRTWLCWFLMLTLGYSVHRCYSLIFYYLEQGHALSEAFLVGLVSATVAQVATILTIFVRFVWKTPQTRKASASKS